LPVSSYGTLIFNRHILSIKALMPEDVSFAMAADLEKNKPTGNIGHWNQDPSNPNTSACDLNHPSHVCFCPHSTTARHLLTLLSHFMHYEADLN
jgi:deoxyribodipyrimidine photolyase-like uncharacterized protein